MNRPDFSLVLGGPLYQAWLRTRIARPPGDHAGWRVVVLTAFAWLPMFVLAAMAGHLVGGVAVPFLVDLDAQARFLGALPLLLGTEILVHRRIRRVVGQFVERGVVAEVDRPHFDALLDSALRWRNSLAVELALLAAAFTFGHWLWLTQLRPDVPTWYASANADGAVLTTAGWWYAGVALPMLRFLLFRWYWRLVVWYRLLWQVSRLPLRLCTLHPDRVAGLGFVRDSVHAFTPLLLAHTVPLAGFIATRISHTGASLPQFRVEIAIVLVVLLAIVLLPLLFFRGPIAAAKSAMAAETGRLVNHDVPALRHADGGDPGTVVATAPALARLADLGRLGDTNERTRTWLFTRGDVVQLAALVAVPLLPLTLTMFPLEEIVRRALDVVF